jgi:hypothetical protein
MRQAHAAHHAAVGGVEQLRVAVVGLQGAPVSKKSNKAV